MLGAYIYYDVDGRLTIEPTQDDISDMSKPTLWTFTPDEQEFMSETSMHDFTTFYTILLSLDILRMGCRQKEDAECESFFANVNSCYWN